MTEKEYLGDQVYAEMDTDVHGQIKLTTYDGISDTNTIYLEYAVTNRLLTFIARARAEDDN